jgi:hypothetical protein
VPNVSGRPEGARLGRGAAKPHGLVVLGQLSQVGVQLFEQGAFERSWHPAIGHDAGEPRLAEAHHPIDKIAEHIDQIGVDPVLEAAPGEGAVGIFGRVGHQSPAPVIRRQQGERLVHEDAAPLGGRELATIPGHPVQRLQAIDELPGLAAAQQGHRKAHGEGDVVLAHELHIGDLIGTLRKQPPDSREIPRSAAARPAAGGIQCS